MQDIIYWLLSDFGFTMIILAVLFILLHLSLRKRVSFVEIVYRWIALFALGFTCVYAAYMHAVYPGFTAAIIGWTSSPFQFEVAMADLALGVLGILSFNASYGFRLATVIAALICLWGDAAGHLYQMWASHNYSSGNAGSWLAMDLLVPFILLLCVIRLKAKR